jgi:hypothetical protein
VVTIADVMAGKLLVQLGLVPAGLVSSTLVAIADEDRTGDSPGDLVARLEAAGALPRAEATRARHLVALYEQVRVEGLFLQSLEKSGKVPKEEAHALLAAQEAPATPGARPVRRRLGALLVAQGRLTEDEDRAILTKVTDGLRRDDAKVVARYRTDGFAGVARPLIPGVTTLGPDSFRVSVVFRSQKTQRIVKAEVERRGLLASPVAELGPELAGESTAELDGGDEGERTVELESPRAQPGRSARAGERTAELDSPRADAGDPGTSRLRSTAERRGPDADEVARALRERRTIGAYEVVECLGQGGMGAVYLARDPEAAGALVAVKVLLAGKAGPEDLARFRREAALLARVRHPSVVHVIEQVRTDDGLDVLVLPAYPGRSLRSVLKARGALPPAEAIQAAVHLCDALDAVHEAGVVHRDLKPENVFVLAGTTLDVRLLDFGIARLADGGSPDPTATADLQFRSAGGVVSGSPAYVAPETITSEPIDGRTDLYSLGVVLFELLTGRTPFRAATPYDLLRAHLLEPPPTLAEATRTAWSADHERLVASLLAKERTDRPPTAKAVRAALRRLPR